VTVAGPAGVVAVREVLVGRAAEVAALRDHLGTVHTGRSPVVLISGEAGAGKTALVEHVLAGAATPVLRGRAGEWPTSAYDVLAQVLRASGTAGGPELAPVLPGAGPVPAGAGGPALRPRSGPR
jgi:hypothetical protein